MYRTSNWNIATPCTVAPIMLKQKAATGSSFTSLKTLQSQQFLWSENTWQLFTFITIPSEVIDNTWWLHFCSIPSEVTDNTTISILCHSEWNNQQQMTYYVPFFVKYYLNLAKTPSGTCCLSETLNSRAKRSCFVRTNLLTLQDVQLVLKCLCHTDEKEAASTTLRR